MPEGHTVHRTATEFNDRFAGRALTVTSPQGRFSASAAQISGRFLIEASAIGKQMFLRFENGLSVRIHLGIYGKWNYQNLGDESQVAAEPVGQVRARFSNQKSVADLRGPTICEVITPAEVKVIEARLGPDPLNANPGNRESERFINNIRKSRSSIGLQLMNQATISGIGNVYRAELLFRAGIDPHTRGNSLTVEQIQGLWDDSVRLLRVGVKTGFMITRDELFTKRPKKTDRNFTYKREGLPCLNCGTNIALEIMATRKLYWCPGCQK